MDLRSPKLFFESGHVTPLLSNFERLFLDHGIVGPLGELLGLSGLGPVVVGLACRQSSLPPFRRPNHARQVGATRALVCNQPILILKRWDPGNFPQCVLAPRARKATLSTRSVRHFPNPCAQKALTRHAPHEFNVATLQPHIFDYFFSVETHITAMPIRPYLQGHRFDAETVRLLGLAFEMALVALQHADGVVSPTRDSVAQKIIELAKAGERDPERLCDEALKATQPLAPALISDPSPLPPPASPPVPPDS